MELTQNPLMDEVRAILNRQQPFIRHHWRAEFVQGEKVVKPLMVTSIDTLRDYVDGFADEMVLEVAIGAGTFAHELYPLRKDLQVRLYREALTPDDPSDPDTQTQMQLFRAILNDDRSTVIEGNVRGASSQWAMDLTDIKYVKFQLVDPAIEQLRMSTTGGIFRNTTTSEVLRHLLTKMCETLKVDETNKVQGVDMWPPSNTEPSRHVVIPHGLAFTDLPDYIEKECAALYSAGLGVYLQQHIWYVYPTHDTTRYDKALKTLTVLNVPSDRFGSGDKTWRETPNQLIVMAAGKTRHRDRSEQDKLEGGNGVRFLDARKVLNGFSETLGNRTQALRADNNHEYAIESRESGLVNAVTSAVQITSNVFRELGKLARRRGAFVRCVWEHSEPSKIFPGMPVKFVYAVRNQIHEAVGTVQHVHHYTSTHETGFSNKRHNTQSILTLHVDGLVDWNETPETY